MTGKFPIRLLKTAILVAAALVYVPLVIDWCAPGQGLHQATMALGGCGADVHRSAGMTHWGALVRLVGWNLRGLGTLSMLGALVSLGLIAFIVEMIMTWAVFTARLFHDADSVPERVVPLSVALVCAAFVVEPGLLRAATRPDPLMVILPALLLGLTFVTRILTELREDDRPQLGREHPWMALFLLLLLTYGLWCFGCLPWLSLLEGSLHLLGFLALGAFPLYLLVRLLLRHDLRLHFLVGYFGVWAAAIAVVAVLAAKSFDHGWASNRMAARIVMNSGGCAFSEDEALNDQFVWLLKENRRLFTSGYDCASASDGEEMMTSMGCFPTVARWREACEDFAKMDLDEPLRDCFGRLIADCGNGFGCQMIENGEHKAAWAMFWEILGRVDGRNCPAILNLCGLLAGDAPRDPEGRERLGLKFQQMLIRAETVDGLLTTIGDGRRLYVDVEMRKHLIRRRQEAGMSPGLPQADEWKAFASPNLTVRETAELVRQALRQIVSAQVLRPVTVGQWMLDVDFYLCDWQAVESDAREILRQDDQHVPANAVMGRVCARKGDYVESERYLRRALAGGMGDDPELLDGLAFAMASMGHPTDAIRLARPLTLAHPDNWKFRETLAFALIRSGFLEDGDRELKIAANLARSAGVSAKNRIRLVVDLAWLYRKQGDNRRLKRVLQVLNGQTGLGKGLESEIKKIAEDGE